MANSLRAKLSKLRHDRHITEEEYQEFIKKLDGHDKQIRADAIEEVLSEIANWNASSSKKIPYAFARYLEQLKTEDGGKE